MPASPTSHQQSRGFLLPSVVILFGASTVILLAIFQYVVATTNLTDNVVYRQMALTAAHAALDYGKSQFDSDIDYAGTSNHQLASNSQYRVTFDLVRLSVNGRSMRVQGVGKVFLPPTATTPKYTRTINGEIINSQISAQDPSDFSPLAWYDASCNAATSAEPGCQLDTVLSSGTISAVGNPTSLREESATGSYCSGAPAVSNVNLSITTGGECGASTQQNVGMVFNLGSQLPKGVTITNAYIQYTAAGVDSTSIVTRVRGIAADNQPNFTTSSSSQLLSVPLTTADSPSDYDGASSDSAITWNMDSWTSIGQSGTRQRTPDIGPVIQQIINRAGWSQGNNIALRIDYKSGSGKRTARLTPITLNITYSGYTPASAGNTVAVWRDRSGHGHHLAAPTTAQRPTKSSIYQWPDGTAPNGKPMIQFDLGKSMFATVPASSGRTANTYSALGLFRVKSATNTGGQGFIVSMYGGGTNEYQYSPFWRHPGPNYHTFDPGTGIDTNSICFARDQVEKMCRQWNGDAANTPGSINTDPNWAMLAMRESLTERDSMLRINGSNDDYGQWQFDDPVFLNAPYYIAIGGWASELPSSLTGYASVEIAELIIYDRMLTCPQIESVEQYMAQKWGFDDSDLPDYIRYISGGCTENTFPAY